MIVSKFGGTSVASAEQIKKVAEIIKANSKRKYVVVSAPGKRFEQDKKVTDLLINLGNSALLGENVEPSLDAVLSRYKEIALGLELDLLICDVIEVDLRSRLSRNQENPSLFMDSLKASGEDNNAKLISTYFTSIGIPARYMTCQSGRWHSQRFIKTSMLV